MKHVLFIFIDGLGIGADDASINPLSRFELPGFSALCGGEPMVDNTPSVFQPTHVYKPIDANLGVDGLPQSGTGQASIFTGINCARLAGKHYGPYPHSSSAEAVETANVFARLIDAGHASVETMAFANTYPARFFSYANRTNRWTVTTRCCMASNVLIRSTDYLKTGEGVAADVTGHGLRSIADDVEPISEEDAARNFLRLGSTMHFTLFEFFHTDKAGHAQSFDRAEKRLKALDSFLSHLTKSLDVSNTLLLVTSDHGNVEDLSTKSHTRNPVPLVAYGKDADHYQDVTDISEIVPTMVQWFSL